MGAQLQPVSTHIWNTSKTEDSCSKDKIQTIKQYQQTLQFIMQTNSTYFGHIRIYRMLQKPHQYIMNKVYNSVSDLSAIKEKYNIQTNNKNLVVPQFINHNKSEGPCGKHYTLEIYCKYFNFTIQDAIKKKGKMNSKFAEGEIFYVASSLLKAYEALNTNNYCQIFKTRKIFLSPQGFLRIYPFKQLWSYNPPNNNTPFPQFSNNCDNYMNPQTEEIKIEVTKKQIDRYGPTMQYIQNDLIDIGLVLLEMLTLDEDYSQEQNNQIDFNKIRFILDSHHSYTHRKGLQIFRVFLKGILLEKWGHQKIAEELCKIGKIYELEQYYSIKLVKAETKQSITTSAMSCDEPFSPNLAKISKQNLVAGRISIIKTKNIVNRND